MYIEYCKLSIINTPFFYSSTICFLVEKKLFAVFVFLQKKE